MRINSPVAPYDDDKMREVLQLIMSSFEHLDEKYDPSYTRRVSILNTLAKCQVCVLMLDPEYVALLIEMFQLLFKALRDHHPMKVFLDIENILTLVLKESDGIPPELLSLILRYVEQDDEVPQISRRLAEQALTNCASKTKTYLAEAVKSSGVSLDKYSNVVASICEGAFSDLKEEEVVANKMEDRQGPREAAVKDKQKAAEVSNPDQTCVSKRRLNLSLPHEKDPAETHKRPRLQSCSQLEKTVAEGEPSCRTHKSSPEPGDAQPCSITHQLAKVKQSLVDSMTSVRQISSELETREQRIVDDLISVRQFRSEIKKKEDNLKASLQEVDVLGM